MSTEGKDMQKCAKASWSYSMMTLPDSRKSNQTEALFGKMASPSAKAEASFEKMATPF